MKEVPLVWPGFAHPWVLFGLLLPALLLCWVWASRWLVPSRRVVLPLDRSPARGGWGWWVLLSLADSVPPLLLAVAVLILAGPQRNGPPQDKRSVTNILFAVDISGSMTAQYGEGTRYDASMKAIDAFLDFRKGDAFGLTFFGTAHVHWCPITTDPSAVKCAPPFMRPEIAPDAFGGTDIVNAVRACKRELVQREDGDRMILLITDGFDSGVDQNEAELTRELVADHVTLFCVIAGGFEPQAAMVNICRASGGDAFSAEDPEVLKAAFHKIDGMKQARITPTIADTIDYYEPFAAAGAAVLLLGTLALFGLRYTPW